MKLFAIAAILPLALAIPAERRQVASSPPAAAPAAPAPMARQLPVCGGTTGNAQCCATDVLGLVDLNCINPPQTPTSKTNFVSICSAVGQQALCCALPILGQALICSEPV